MPNKSRELMNQSAERQRSFQRTVKVGGRKITWSNFHDDKIIDSLVYLGFYYTPTKSDVNCITCVYCNGTESVETSFEISKILENHNINHHDCFISLRYIAGEIHKKTNDEIFNYFNEQKNHLSSPLSKLGEKFRLKFYGKSFIHDLNKFDKISSKNLAKSGFIYNKLSRDEVVCPYCECSLAEWEENDDPLQLHTNSNDDRYCYFLSQLHKKGQVENSKNVDISNKNRTIVDEKIVGAQEAVVVIDNRAGGGDSSDSKPRPVTLKSQTKESINDIQAKSSNVSRKNPKNNAKSSTPKIDPNDAYWDKPPDDSLFDDLINVAKSPRLMSNKESGPELELSKALKLEDKIPAKVKSSQVEDVHNDFGDFLEDPLGADSDTESSNLTKLREAKATSFLSPNHNDELIESDSPEFNDLQNDKNTQDLGKLQIDDISVSTKCKKSTKQEKFEELALSSVNNVEISGAERDKKGASQTDLIEILVTSRRRGKNKSIIEDSSDEIEDEIQSKGNKSFHIDKISEYKTTKKIHLASTEKQSTTNSHLAESKQNQERDEKDLPKNTVKTSMKRSEMETDSVSSSNLKLKKTKLVGKARKSKSFKEFEEEESVVGDASKPKLQQGKRLKKIKLKKHTPTPTFDTSHHDVNDYGDTNLKVLEENINLVPSNFDTKHDSLNSDVEMQTEFVSPIRLERGRKLPKKNITKISMIQSPPKMSIFDKSMEDITLESKFNSLQFSGKGSKKNLKDNLIHSDEVNEEPSRRETRSRKSKQIATTKISKDYLAFIENLELDTEDSYIDSSSESENLEDENVQQEDKFQNTLKHKKINIKPVVNQKISLRLKTTLVGEPKRGPLEESAGNTLNELNHSNLTHLISDEAGEVDGHEDKTDPPSGIESVEGSSEPADDYAEYISSIKQLSANYLATMELILSSENSASPKSEPLQSPPLNRRKTASSNGKERSKTPDEDSTASRNDKDHKPEISLQQFYLKNTDSHKVNIQLFKNEHRDSDILDISDIEKNKLEEFDSYVAVFANSKSPITSEDNIKNETDGIEDIPEALDVKKLESVDSDSIDDNSVAEEDQKTDGFKINEEKMDLDNTVEHQQKLIEKDEADVESDVEMEEAKADQSYLLDQGKVINVDKVSIKGEKVREAEEKGALLLEQIPEGAEVEDHGQELIQEDVEKEGEGGEVEGKRDDVDQNKEIHNEDYRSGDAPFEIVDTDESKEPEKTNLSNKKLLDTQTNTISRVSSKTHSGHETGPQAQVLRNSQLEPAFQPRGSPSIDGNEAFSPLKIDNFNNLDSSTPQKISSLKHEDTSTQSTPPNIEQDSIAQLFKERQEQIKDTSHYLKSLINSDYNLHNDLDSELTHFISNMPEEEQEMTVMEWVKFNAANCRRMIMDDCDLMNKLYQDQYLKKLTELENLPTID
jgi:hypothetical protein